MLHSFCDRWSCWLKNNNGSGFGRYIFVPFSSLRLTSPRPPRHHRVGLSWDAALPIPTGLVHVVTSVCFHMCMYIGAASDVYSGHAWGIAHAQHVLRRWTRGNADVCVCVCVCVCARAREYACICIYSFSTSSHAHLTCDMSL